MQHSSMIHGDKAVAKITGDSKNHAKRPRGKTPREKPALTIPTLLQVLVECQSERQQQEVFELLRREGYPCRVLTL